MLVFFFRMLCSCSENASRFLFFLKRSAVVMHQERLETLALSRSLKWLLRKAPFWLSLLWMNSLCWGSKQRQIYYGVNLATGLADFL